MTATDQTGAPAARIRHPQPTEAGFYWARWLCADPGTREGDELTPALAPEVVSVFENCIDRGNPEYLMVEVPGVEHPQSLDCFEWLSGRIRRFETSAENMPDPGTLLTYPDGYTAPAMFHYAGEGADLKAIAENNGFDMTSVSWFDDVGKTIPEDDYTEDTIKAWRPDIGDGWQLAMKFDTDDGPVALFIRPQDYQSGVAA